MRLSCVCRGVLSCLAALLAALAISLPLLQSYAARSLPLPLAQLGPAANAPEHRRSGGCARASPRSAGLPAPGVVASRTLEMQGLERKYLLRLPSVYRQNSTFPLVIALHGAGDSGVKQAVFDKLVCISDRAPFIVAYPEGSGDCPSGKRAWNVPGATVTPVEGPLGPTCGPDPDSPETLYGSEEDQSWHSYGSCAYRDDLPPTSPDSTVCYYTSCLDDVAYIMTLQQRLQEEFCVDAARIYMLGFSMGGQTTLWLAQRPLAQSLAAATAISSAPFLGYNLPPAGDVPLLHLHGRYDITIPMRAKRWLSGEESPSAVDRRGPHNSTIGEGGFFYTPRREMEATWASAFKCKTRRSRPENVSTAYDLANGLHCVAPAGTCADTEAEASHLLSCVGDWGHFDAEFSWRREDSFNGELAWAFFSSFWKPQEGGPVRQSIGPQPFGSKVDALNSCILFPDAFRDMLPFGLGSLFLPGMLDAICLELLGLSSRLVIASLLILSCLLAHLAHLARVAGAAVREGDDEATTGGSAAPLLRAPM